MITKVRVRVLSVVTSISPARYPSVVLPYFVILYEPDVESEPRVPLEYEPLPSPPSKMTNSNPTTVALVQVPRMAESTCFFKSFSSSPPPPSLLLADCVTFTSFDIFTPCDSLEILNVMVADFSLLESFFPAVTT